MLFSQRSQRTWKLVQKTQQSRTIGSRDTNLYYSKTGSERLLDLMMNNNKGNSHFLELLTKTLTKFVLLISWNWFLRRAHDGKLLITTSTFGSQHKSMAIIALMQPYDGEIKETSNSSIWDYSRNQKDPSMSGFTNPYEPEEGWPLRAPLQLWEL